MSIKKNCASGVPEYEFLLSRLVTAKSAIAMKNFSSAEKLMEGTSGWIDILNDKELSTQTMQLKTCIEAKNSKESSILMQVIMHKFSQDDVRSSFSIKMAEFKEKVPEILGY